MSSFSLRSLSRSHPESVAHALLRAAVRYVRNASAGTRRTEPMSMLPSCCRVTSVVTVAVLVQST